jgi:peptidoglycan/LPS O-acetylase OafA/YrhL
MQQVARFRRATDRHSRWLTDRHSRGDADRHSRNSALDGLRALAVVAVFLFHSGVSRAPGGMFGVDAFFVLSGYLITGLLLAEHGALGRLRLGRFWGLRARRLLPAMLAMVIVVVLLWRHTAPPGQLAGLRGDALATMGYVANWHFVLTGQSYFAQTAAASPLLHMWSLAVEEQFYLVWPLVVWLLLRRRAEAAGIRLVRVVAVGGALAATLSTAIQAQAGANVSRLYYGTDTRAAMLLTGAALATVLPLQASRVRGSRTMPVIGVASLAGLVALVMTVNGQAAWLYRGGYLLVSVLTAGVLAGAVAAPGGPFAAALSVWPLRALGRISYAVYLWHWPVVLYLTHARTGRSGLSLLGVRALVTVALATASWLVIESPVRRSWQRLGRRRAVRPAWLPAGALAAVLAVAIGVAAGATSPAGTGVAIAALPAGSVLGTAETPAARTPAAQPATPDDPSPAPAAKAASGRPAAPALVSGRPVRIGFMGDSQSFMILNGIQRKHSADAMPVQLSGTALLGCGVLGYGIIRNKDTVTPPASYLTKCNTWPQFWQDYLATSQPDVVLLSLGPWEMVDRIWRGEWHNIVDGSSYANHVLAQVEAALRLVASSGSRLAVLETPCFYGEKPDGSVYPQYSAERLQAFRSMLRQAITDVRARTPEFSVQEVSANSVLCPNGKFSWHDPQGRQIRMDDIHVTEQGGAEVGDLLLPQLVTWARTGQLPGPASSRR